jgi:hypothetical protein
VSTIVFVDQSRPPSEARLAKALGAKASARWEELKRLVHAADEGLVEEWSFGGRKYGWSLKLRAKKRAILYLVPCEGGFRIGIALPEGAVEAAHGAGLPQCVVALVDAAPRFPEGRGVRMEIESRQDVRVAAKLARLKVASVK